MTTIVFIVAPIIGILLVIGVCLLNRDEDASMLKSMRANHAIKLKSDKAHQMALRSRKKKYH